MNNKLILVIIIAVLIAISCNKPEKRRQNAELYYSAEKYELALKEINKAIALEPDTVSHYSLRILIYDKQGKYIEELIDLDKIIKLNKSKEKEPINPYFQRAFVNTQLGFNDEALRDINYFLEHANDSVHDIPSAYLNKASILYQMNDFKSAKKYYELARNSNHSEELVSQAIVGLANITDNKHKKLQLLNKAIEVNDSCSLAFGARGTIYFNDDRFEEAFSDYLRAIKLNTDDAAIYNNLGQIHVHYTKNLDLALICFKKAIKLAPQFPGNDMIYMSIGAIEHQQGDQYQALKSFKKAEKINPKNDQLLYNMAMLLSEMNRNDEALEKINKAIEINEYDAESYNLKGSILLSQYKLDYAEKEFLNAIKTDWKYGGAYYNLGYLYSKQEKTEKSINYYEKAIDLNFNLKATLVNCAIQKLKLNRISSACSDLRRAYNLGRKDIQPLLDQYCN